MQHRIKAKLAGLAVAATGVFLSPTPSQASILATRCAADPLSPAMARLRLEWARACGVKINVISPTNPPAPAFTYLTGVNDVNGVPLHEYIETDDFWGKNSYSGDVEAVNQVFTQSQWRVGPYIATTAAGGFQKWTESDTLLLPRPFYPVFGNNADINVATSLFPNPNYSLLDCKLYKDPLGMVPADTSTTGFFVNGFCTSTTGCADGTIEQVFAGGMVGCAATATYANRASLCAPGYRVATAAEWVGLRNGIAPTHNYWTNDPLKFNGTGPSSCFVSTSVGNDCGATPMRVCTGTDPEGNVCNWTHCGIDANTPDQFFGGCSGNTSAGAVCVPNTGCANGSVAQAFGKGMVGCAGAVTFANRATLCASGYRPATSAQWVSNRGTAVPTHNYWTDDALKFSGSGPSACSVSTTVGNDCGTTPMRVCTAAGTDTEGNACNWTHCGINTTTPDQFFGGCSGNTAAGTICMPAQGTAGTLFTPHFAAAERHSTQGAITAGSFAAAAMMGAQGFSNIAAPANWESLLSSSCTSLTTSQAPGSVWPANCNPGGMAAEMTVFTSNDWETRTWASTDKASALNETVASLQFYQSPAVVPIYGQADHWVTITQITATNSGTSWTISQLKGFDGGPSGQADSSGNSYASGLQAWAGTVWSNVFYQPVTVINSSCDTAGCTSDPYYNRYMLVSDPPRGLSHPPVSAVFAKAPGIVPEGPHAMNEHLAQTQVWKALTAAGLDADPEIWKAIHGGVPGTAFGVNAVWPSGSAWNYYLVPILGNANKAVAFVQLSADDGSFESIHVPTSPAPFTPVTMTRAQQLARGALAKGERLTGGTLTWDPRRHDKMVKSPLRPYYQFGVTGAPHPKNDVGVIRVPLDGGAAVRSSSAST